MDKHQWHSPDSQAASDYVEGRLQDRRLFEEHLDECTRCRLDVEALQRMRGQTRTWDEEEPYHKTRTYKPLFSGLALALPVLLILLGLSLTPKRPTPPSAKTQWTTGQAPQTLTIDGQSLQLGPHSRLQQISPKRLRLANGQLRVPPKLSNLEVETDQIQLKSLGADLEVFHAKGLTRVHLYSGKAKLRQKSDGRNLLLDSRQKDWPQAPKAAR